MKDKIQKLDKRIQMLTKALNDLQSNYEEKVVELSVIRKTADLFTYEFDLKEACQKTLDILYKELHPENSSIHIRNPDSNIFEPFTVKGKQIAGHKKNVITNKIIGTRFRPGMGTAGWAAQNKKIVYIPDVSKDTRFFAGIETKIDIGSLICVPLLNQDNVEGILNLSHSAKHAFPKRSLNFLNILMKSIGAGIGNIRLFNEYTDAYSALLKTNQELQNTLNDLHDTRLVILNSEKLSGTRILAAGIAHEFNKIRAGIYGYSELSLLNKSPYEIDS
ncbi:MAG: GAF domain-containing protein, partial [bacterium]|nr:GAF domain-containing protein [bacterium]